MKRGKKVTAGRESTNEHVHNKCKKIYFLNFIYRDKLKKIVFMVSGVILVLGKNEITSVPNFRNMQHKIIQNHICEWYALCWKVQDSKLSLGSWWSWEWERMSDRKCVFVCGLWTYKSLYSCVILVLRCHLLFSVSDNPGTIGWAVFIFQHGGGPCEDIEVRMKRFKDQDIYILDLEKIPGS